MSTSGTVGRTVVDVASVIEKAVKKCGVLPTVLTAETLQDAKMDLFLVLTGLATKGINLWSVKKDVYASRVGGASYMANDGTEDILNTLRRQGTAALQSALAAALASYSPTTSTKVISVIVQPAAAGAYALVLESSDDGASWASNGALAGTTTATGATLCFDADPTAAHLFWRVRETVALTAAFTSVHFLSACSEVTMGKLSRDSYTSLPDKTSTGDPLQFWFDKQDPPVLRVWPVPTVGTMQFVVWSQRQIQDVGEYSNTIDVPDRWLEYVIYALGSKIILEIPKELIDSNRIELLKIRADELERMSADSETDGAPIRIRPNLRSYTR